MDKTNRRILGYAVTFDLVSDSDVMKFLDGDGGGQLADQVFLPLSWDCGQDKGAGEKPCSSPVERKDGE